MAFFPFPRTLSLSLPLLFPMPMKAFQSENRAHSHTKYTLLCSSLFSHRPFNSNKTAQNEAFLVHAYAAHSPNRVSKQNHSLLVSFILIQYGCSVEIWISRRTATKRCLFRKKTKFYCRFIKYQVCQIESTITHKRPMIRDICLLPIKCTAVNSEQWTVVQVHILNIFVKWWEFVTF